MTTVFSVNKRSAVFGRCVRQGNPSSTYESKIVGFQMFFVYFELGPWSAWSHDLPGMFAEKLIVNNYCVCIFEQNAIIFNSATAYMRAMNYNRIFFTNTGRALTSGTDSDPRILTTKTCYPPSSGRKLVTFCGSRVGPHECQTS